MRHHPRMAAPPADAPKPLTLHLHAEIGVHGPGGLLLPLRGRAAGLVALVALEPGIRRARAAALLWPEADQPRNNLRQQLARFRTALGRPLLDGEDELHLAKGVQCAAAPAGSELLAGEPAAEDEFGTWLQAARLSDRAARRQPLQRAMAQAEARGDLDALLALAREALALEPDDEAAHAALMQAHFLRGEAAQGQAVFRQLQAQLQQRQGGAPTAATRQLAEALMRSEPAPAVAAALPVALPPTLKRPPRLAGRERELADARTAWALGQVVLLEGEAGLGKTRLVAELAAAGSDVLVAAGRPGDGGTPYSTLERLLQPLLARPANHLDGTSAATLARWQAPAAQGPALRAGALQAAVDALLADQHIQTLALDDLHFADDATLELLAALATAEPPRRRWLFAQRPAEATEAGRALRDALIETQRLATVSLAPLDSAAAAQLVDALGIAGLQGATVAEPLVRHTGGNPLFLLETLKQGLLDGSLAQGRLSRPSSVGALIERRLHRLSEPALNLARVAAVAGTDFSIGLAEAVIGVRAVQLSGAWAELEAAQVLRDDAFAHDLVHDAARRLTPAVLTRHLHGSVAAFLEQQAGAAARIAHHWLGAEAFGKALPWLHAAARQAGVALRRREELAFLERAAEIEERLALPAAFDTLVAIWDCYDTADRTGFDGPLLDRIDRAAEIGGPSDSRRAVAHRVRSHTLLRQGRLQEAAEVGERGLRLAAASSSWQTQAEIAQSVAAAWHSLGDPGRGLDLMRRLLPDVERIEGQPGTKATYYLDLAVMLSAMDRQAEAVAYQERGVSLALESGNVEHAAMGRTNQGFTLITLGRLERALEMLRDAERLLAISDAAEGAGLSLTLHLGRALRDVGHFAGALQATERSVEELRTQLPYLRPLALAQLGLIWLRLGQTARAQQALGEARAGDVAAPWMVASLKTLEARVEQALGRDPAPALREGLAAAPLGQRRMLRYMLLAESLRLRDAGADTLAVAERAIAEAEGLGLASAELALSAMAAPLALRLGQTARAEALSRRAARLLEDTYPFDLYLPEAWLQVALTREGLDDAEGARQALAAAARWVAAAAQRHVPPAFIDSFLRRNPVNAALAHRLQGEPALAGLLRPAFALISG